MGIDRSERIDHDLEFLLVDADDLAETLPDWAEISESERDIWLFDWPNDLAILERLDRSRKAMNAKQRGQYAELLDKLRVLVPELEGSGLRRPSVLDQADGR